MNSEVKKKWVDALRSGEYKQGHCALKSADDKYCCLGVLCDLAVKEGVAREERVKNLLFEYYFDGEAALLPVSVIEWAGLDDPVVLVKFKDANLMLYKLNDSYRLTFNEIADLIEEQL